MLKDGKPDVTNDDVTSAVDYIKGLNDAGVIAPGSATMKEQDKVEEFTNGRVGMMIDSLSHIDLIRESNPDLKFSISAIPAEDGFTGERGIPYASWGIGVSDKQRAQGRGLEARAVPDERGDQLRAVDPRERFPGQHEGRARLLDERPAVQGGLRHLLRGQPANEFVGLPVAEQLMRLFDEQLQATLHGETSGRRRR